MQHKRGDSFQFAATIPLSKPDGYYKDWALPRCQIRTVGGVLKQELSVKWLNADKTRVLIVSYPTGADQEWKLGAYKLDIQFTRTVDGYVDSTKNYIMIELIDDVTKPL